MIISKFTLAARLAKLTISMNNQKLLLCFPGRNPATIKRLFPDGAPVFFLYLGKDYFSRRYLDRALGKPFIRIDIAKTLNKAADDIRKEHVQWMDDLNISYGHNLKWWFGSISSRNNYSSDLFQFSCYLEVLEILWNNKHQRPQVIFVESLGFAKAIKNWAYQKGIIVEIINGPKELSNYLALMISSFFKLVYFSFILLLRFIGAYASKRTLRRNKMVAKKLSIIDTYLLDSCLADDGYFKDSYFPFLHEYLVANDYQVLIHPILYGFQWNYFSIYRRMRQSQADFIIAEDFLKFSDYLNVLSYPFSALRLRIKAPNFRNFDLSAVLKEEQRKSFADNSSLLSCLIYRLFLRLGQEGLRPELIICWYENQVNDKALIAGARQVFPGAQIIGAQIFLHAPNWLNPMPSQSEADFQMVPHVLLETSKHQCKVAQSFTKAIPCHPAASLRYAHLYHEANQNGKTCLKQEVTIMVLLPHELAESIEMLDMIATVTEDIRDDVNIFIKGHYCYTQKQLVQGYGKGAWPARFSLYSDSLPEALNIAKMVISSNTSAMVEAVARGIPTISITRQTLLNHDMLANINYEIVSCCYTKDELIRAIWKYLELTDEEIMHFRELGKTVREVFFSPISSETMKPFLGDQGVPAEITAGCR